MQIYVLLVETTCMNTELYPGPPICDGTYSRVGSPGKRWLIKQPSQRTKTEVICGSIDEENKDK